MDERDNKALNESKGKEVPTKKAIFKPKLFSDQHDKIEYEWPGIHEQIYAAMTEYSDLKCQPLLERIKTLENTIAINTMNISDLSDHACIVEDIEIKLGFGIDSFIEKYEYLLRAIESWKKEEEIWNEHLKELQEAADKLADALESAINGHIDSERFERFMKLLAEYNKLKGK